MSSASSEQTVFSNQFGELSDRRIVYNTKKNWFSGKFREDIPLKQVASVRHETTRSWLWGIFWIVVGLSALKEAAVVGILCLGLAVILIWGSPKVVVVTTGGTATPSVGLPWDRKAAEAFVNALRNQLFKE